MFALVVISITVSLSVLALVFLTVFGPKKHLPRTPLGIRVVCISDTHMDHESLSDRLPAGDILIHAGDFTAYGRDGHTEVFNDWLGRMRTRGGFQHVIVVNGNHESNAPWQKRAAVLLSHATFLRDEGVTCHVRRASDQALLPVHIHGANFFWPMHTPNPYYALVPSCEPRLDVLVCHGPCRGRVDGGQGCAQLLKLVERTRPRLVVSGHVHAAHGRVTADGITFVNAANCAPESRRIGFDPIVVEL